MTGGPVAGQIFHRLQPLSPNTVLATGTSQIIAGAGIVVRNSMLTAAIMVVGSAVILLDPIFQGLVIALMMTILRPFGVRG